MSDYVFSGTTETFGRDYAMSWLLFGQCFITNTGPGRRPVVQDPTNIVVTVLSRKTETPTTSTETTP